ncbi:hypothetical protein MKEN_00162200 [Mycena kentingensis (nom. inval.)]|nr:hypothetical protein MKEN_00162200 [Mycena kentingensis (nom. inval.)]
MTSMRSTLASTSPPRHHLCLRQHHPSPLRLPTMPSAANFPLPPAAQLPLPLPHPIPPTLLLRCRRRRHLNPVRHLCIIFRILRRPSHPQSLQRLHPLRDRDANVPQLRGVPKPSLAPLPITLQLTDDWWGARGGPSIAGIASPPTPTLSMRPPEAHRPLVEKREHEHFDLFYWLEPGMKARGILVDKCPRFPKYKLDDAAADYAPELFVGIGPKDKLDVYYPKYCTWMGAHRDVLLTVSTGGVIFVRRQNEGWDEVALEKEMAGYIPEPSTNIVYELKAERKAVRDSYAKLRKLGKGGLPWVDEDEDEDEDERRSQSRKRTQSAAELPPSFANAAPAHAQHQFHARHYHGRQQHTISDLDLLSRLALFDIRLVLPNLPSLFLAPVSAFTSSFPSALSNAASNHDTQIPQTSVRGRHACSGCGGGFPAYEGSRVAADAARGEVSAGVWQGVQAINIQR